MHYFSILNYPASHKGLPFGTKSPSIHIHPLQTNRAWLRGSALYLRLREVILFEIPHLYQMIHLNPTQEVLRTQQISPQISFRTYGLKAITTGNSSKWRAGFFVNLHSRPLLFGLQGSFKTRPH